MRHVRHCTVGAALLSPLLLAATLLGQDSTTAPPPGDVDGPQAAGAPAARPAPAKPPALSGKILVLPFAPVNGAAGAGAADAWVGRSVQRSLVADLLMVVPDH